MNIILKPYDYLKQIFNNHNVYVNLIVGSGIYASLHPLLDKILSKVSEKYNTYNYTRKSYIMTNILKSGVLSLLAYLFSVSIWKGDLSFFKTNEWESMKKMLINFSGIYIMTDFVALFLNKNMQTNTIFHHICVVLSFFYLCNSNYKKEGIHKAIIVYGGFSSFAWLVNFYLGSRFLEIPIKIQKYIKLFSFISYFLVCSSNWSWQGYYLYNITKNNNSSKKEIGIYLMMLYFWIRDDINLMKFLKK